MNNILCYTCNRFVDKDHECEQAKKLIENPVDLGTAYIHSDAVPTRWGKGKGGMGGKKNPYF
jgi:hypothetical protein